MRLEVKDFPNHRENLRPQTSGLLHKMLFDLIESSDINRYTIKFEIGQPLEVLHGVIQKLLRDTPLLKLGKKNRIQSSGHVSVLASVINHLSQWQI